MKKLNSILLGLGLAFLAYLLWKVGPGELWGQLRHLGWGVLLLILAEGFGNVAHTLGWQHCIPQCRRAVPTVRLFPMAMAGYAINYLTPSASVGGDISRAVLLSSEQKGAGAIGSVVLDKLMTGLAHLLLVVGGAVLIFWQVKLSIEWWSAMAVTTILLTGAMLVFFLLQKHGQVGGVFRWLARHGLGGRFAQRAAEHVSAVDRSLKAFYRDHPRDLLKSLAWHLLGHTAAIAQAWLFLVLLRQPTSWSMVAAAGILSLWFDLLTFVVPMNLGTLEGTRMLVFKALGCQALLGVTFGVAVRLAQLFWACFGLVSYAVLASDRSGPGASDHCHSPERFTGAASELPNLMTGRISITREPE